MLVSAIPVKFSIIFAASAPAGDVTYPFPTTAQPSGLASLPTGFVPLNFVPVDAGGIPPWGKDMNGILYQSTAWEQWLQAGAPVGYDAAFSSDISGYPKGALIVSATAPGLGWVSTVDNNVSDPDTGGANWLPVVHVASSARTNAAISTVYTFAGNPNGSVAGTAATATSPPDMCWDRTNSVLYACTVSGSAASAVWVAINFSQAAYGANTVILGSGAPGFNTAGPGATGIPLLGAGPSNPPLFTPLDLGGPGVTGIAPVNVGGTGRNTLTAHRVLLGEGGSPIGEVPSVSPGYVLTDNGPSADPSFQIPRFRIATRTTTIPSGTDTVTLSDCEVLWNPGVGEFSINWQLPDSPPTGTVFILKCGLGQVAGQALQATVLPAAGGNIDGVSSFTMSFGLVSWLTHFGSNFWALSVGNS